MIVRKYWGCVLYGQYIVVIHSDMDTSRLTDPTYIAGGDHDTLSFQAIFVIGEQCFARNYTKMRTRYGLYSQGPTLYVGRELSKSRSIVSQQLCV